MPDVLRSYEGNHSLVGRYRRAVMRELSVNRLAKAGLAQHDGIIEKDGIKGFSGDGILPLNPAQSLVGGVSRNIRPVPGNVRVLSTNHPALPKTVPALPVLLRPVKDVAQPLVRVGSIERTRIDNPQTLPNYVEKEVARSLSQWFSHTP